MTNPQVLDTNWQSDGQSWSHHPPEEFKDLVTLLVTSHHTLGLVNEDSEWLGKRMWSLSESSYRPLPLPRIYPKRTLNRAKIRALMRARQTVCNALARPERFPGARAHVQGVTAAHTAFPINSFSVFPFRRAIDKALAKFNPVIVPHLLRLPKGRKRSSPRNWNPSTLLQRTRDLLPGTNEHFPCPPRDKLSLVYGYRDVGTTEIRGEAKLWCSIRDASLFFR